VASVATTLETEAASWSSSIPEDCKVINGQMNHLPIDTTVRRTISALRWEAKPHNQGYFNSGFDAAPTFDEVIFYKNGYKSNPRTDPDPRRTIFDRNIYQSHSFHSCQAQHRGVDPVWDELFPAEQARVVKLLVERVIVHPSGLDVRIRTGGLQSLVSELQRVVDDARTAPTSSRQASTCWTCPMTPPRHGTPLKCSPPPNLPQPAREKPLPKK